MQKTYDEVYLVCSTAIYFEQQVRLDQMYPHELTDRVAEQRE